MISVSESLDGLKTFLAQTQLWQGLSSDCIDLVAKIAVLQTYSKGRLIFSEGEAGRGFFILRSGRVKVFKVSPEGKEQILHVFCTGDHFAEVAALDGQCFPASAAALESAAVLFFSREAFVDFLQHHPTLAINVLASFARRLRQFTQLIEALSLKAVPSRLAAYLLALSEQANHADTVKLDLTKGQLAAVIGTIPETLSRVFLKLSREGLIELNGSRITVLDRQQLEQLSLGGRISEVE